MKSHRDLSETINNNKAINTKTPSRNKKANIGMIYNKTFAYTQGLRDL